MLHAFSIIVYTSTW